MEISPAAGKILGMLMAYGVSFLGLLLAYYNWRKRVGKGERGPSEPAHHAEEVLQERGELEAPRKPTAAADREAPRTSATARLGVAAAIVVALVVVFWAASFGRDGRTGWEAIRHNFAGIALPVVIFAISFWVTWLLYRHFSAKAPSGD